MYQPLPAQCGQAEPGAGPGSGAELQELSGRKVTWRIKHQHRPAGGGSRDRNRAAEEAAAAGIVVVVAVLVVVAVALWWRSTFSEDTDDAQVNGHLIQVSSRIRAGAEGGRGREPGGEGGRHDCRAGPQGLQRRGGERAGRAGQRAGQRRGGQRECAAHDHQHGQQPAFGGMRM
jgi:hypothetical protein